ncbi:hypothetical protein HY256_09535 [Candidatus Sumerlaeota bacterium]|nr:hypothetical protein [Candidatus Sumerlaeota bacterium]
MSVTLDKSVYRPGEAVIMEVTVTNTTDKPIRIQKLDSRSASFWVGSKNSEERFQRMPVISKLEEKSLNAAGSDLTVLEPHKSLTRPFIHTFLTKEPGTYLTQAHLSPFADITSTHTGKIYSNPSEFEVRGDPLFGRDSEGLILKKDAEALGRELAKSDGEVLKTDSILAEDQHAGFYIWWVNVECKRADGSVIRTAYVIDPYRGRSKGRGKPFPDTLKPKSPEIKTRIPKSPEATPDHEDPASTTQP